jgi:hypothetical protein
MSVEPIFKAVYCQELGTIIDAHMCTPHCKCHKGYAFCKGKGDKFGVICTLSKTGFEPTWNPEI